jgi:hypothetical protein
MVGNYSTHVCIVNVSIDDDDKSMFREFEQLTRHNHDLKEQTENPKGVLGTLCVIKREFAQRQNADRERRREEAACAAEEKRCAEADTLARSLSMMRQQL